ncbi:MAG: YqeG family HAD IIIA-type phosphatase [Clostridia bacterium]
MKLYPDLYLNNVKEITLEILKKNKIKGLILDVDNTLIDYDKNLMEGAKQWCDNLKQSGIKICILSNTNKIKKVAKVAKTLDLEYIYFAHKPNKKGFYKARELLGLELGEIATVGDQVFTDVLGGNRVGMFTILTKPIDKRDIALTKIKRPFEKVVIKKYLKNKGEK